MLHWWHPPLSKGMRTRFADDLLWLLLLTAYYLQSTGDWSVLDSRRDSSPRPRSRTREGRGLPCPPTRERSPTSTSTAASPSTARSAWARHGLPLFGTGDWNDGMNRVGRKAAARASGWASSSTRSRRLRSICERRGDQQRAGATRHRESLRVALNDGGWDGEWYRRAYYDDGARRSARERRGAASTGLAQAWSVLSHAPRPIARTRRWTRSRSTGAPDERDGIIRLLTPAFRDRRTIPATSGLRGGRAGERRPVHARRPVGGARDGRTRPARRAGALHHAEPGPPHGD